MAAVLNPNIIQTPKQVPEASFESQFTGTPPDKSQRHYTLDHPFAMEATQADLERERSHEQKHEKRRSGHHSPFRGFWSGRHTPKSGSQTPKSGHHTPDHGAHHEHHHSAVVEKVAKALFEPPHPPEFDPHAVEKKAERRKSHEHHHDLKSVLSFGHRRSSDEGKSRKSTESHESHKSHKSTESHKSQKSSGSHKHPHLEKLAHDMFDPPHPTDRPHPIHLHRHSHSRDKRPEKRKSGEHSPKDHSKFFSFEATRDDLHREEEKVRKSIEKAEARKSGEHQPANVEKLWSFEATAADRKYEEEKARRHRECSKGRCAMTEEEGKPEACPREHSIERKPSPGPKGAQGLIPDGTYGPV